MDNIYIRALKIGADSLDEGISYNDIIEKLGIKERTGTFKNNFRFWFYSNFYHDNTQRNLDNRRLFFPDELDSKKSILLGEAFINYLDYVELKEARQSAKTAKRYAIIAIWIAIVSIIAQTLFNIFMK